MSSGFGRKTLHIKNLMIYLFSVDNLLFLVDTRNPKIGNILGIASFVGGACTICRLERTCTSCFWKDQVT